MGDTPMNPEAFDQLLSRHFATCPACGYNLRVQPPCPTCGKGGIDKTGHSPQCGVHLLRNPAGNPSWDGQKLVVAALQALGEALAEMRQKAFVHACGAPMVTTARRPIDPKYDMLWDGAWLQIVKSGTNERLPDDEPLLLFRAGDRYALDGLIEYRNTCAETCDDFHIESMNQRISAFRKFKHEHPERMKRPDTQRA